MKKQNKTKQKHVISDLFAGNLPVNMFSKSGNFSDHICKVNVTFVIEIYCMSLQVRLYRVYSFINSFILYHPVTRRFSNHVSRLLSRSHTFAIIVILDLKIHQSMWIHWLFFPKTWTKGHWPLDDLWPHVCWGHIVWLYPRIIVSKSHDNTSMCVDIVINFAKYHIHTYTYYVHTTYYVQNEWSHSLLLNSVQVIT